MVQRHLWLVKARTKDSRRRMGLVRFASSSGALLVVSSLSGCIAIRCDLQAAQNARVQLHDNVFMSFKEQQCLSVQQQCCPSGDRPGNRHGQRAEVVTQPQEKPAELKSSLEDADLAIYGAMCQICSRRTRRQAPCASLVAFTLLLLRGWPTKLVQVDLQVL